MSLTESQIAECAREVEAFMGKRRPRPEIRDQLDIGAEIKGQEVLISEIRPAFNDPSRTRQSPIGKARWIASRKIWQLYWMRADLRWHEYEMDAQARTIHEALAEIDRDPHGCFWG